MEKVSPLHAELQKDSSISLLKVQLPPCKNSFKAADLEIQEATKKKDLPAFDNKIGFGIIPTDHMLILDWDSTNGWSKPKILEYHNFEIDPLSTVFHYAIECFEGMKAYKDENGKIRLFRPELNVNRLRHSGLRVGLPDFDGDEFLKLVKEYTKLESRWIPQIPEYSLYLRPTFISTWDRLGVGVAQSARLFVVATPAALYFTQGLFPLKIYVEKQAVRAHAGSNTGQYKLGSNYAHTIYFKSIAIKKYACNEVLWTNEDYITELGAANVFVYWKNENGEEELRTHPNDDLVLHGVTRESVIEVGKKLGLNVKLEPTKFSDIKKAAKEGRLLEMFCCGTALIVASIGQLMEDENTIIDVPYNKEKGIGELANKIRSQLLNIQLGKTESDWAVPIN